MRAAPQPRPARVGNQVVTRYVRKSDGTPVAGLSETWPLQGVEGGFIPPPS
jgi:hypothetical protein